MDKILFESKAWEIVDSEGMIFLVNKRFKSEGRYEQDVEVTAETIETAQIKGVKIPEYIRVALKGIFEQLLEAEQAAKEQVKIEQINDTVIATTPNGPFALIIGKTFNIDYKDQHGEYYLEDLLFLGCGPAKDCLLFRNDRGDILHMEPQKVQRVTINLEPTDPNEAAHLILEMEKQIEEELKPFVAPDLVKLFAVKAAINGDRLVRAIKENEPWTDEDSLVSSGVMIRNGYTDATLYLSETYILEYLDKVSGKIFVISDLFYRGHYKDFLLFNKRGSYWVLMADQVKKVVQQDKFVGGAF
jgi:hypothetical protein